MTSPPPDPRDRPPEPTAVAALCTGVVLPPVGIGLGIVGLRRARRDGTRGVGLAVAGIVIGAAVTIFWVVTIALALADARATTPVVAGTEGTAHVRGLVVGTCLAGLPSGDRVTRVDVVGCDQPHGAQVIARTDWRDDAHWPGADAVRSTTTRVCGPDELTGDGIAPDDVDDFRLVVWTPSEASWEGGDRTGLCVAATDEPRTENLVG